MPTPKYSSPSADDPTIGRLVADASRDVSSLIQSEIALAKTELKVSIQAGGVGIALVAAAGFLLLIVTILVSMTIAYFLTMTGMHVAWAFLIVTLLYVVIAAVLVFVAYTRFRKVKAPEKTISSAKSISQALNPTQR